MSKSNLIEFMSKYSKDDPLKLLTPINLKKEFSSSINRFSGEIVLDVFDYNGKTYYKDKNGIILNDNAKPIGVMDNDKCLFF